MRKCQVRELGRIGYGRGLELQQELIAARKEGRVPDQLLLLEHSHVITMGRNGRQENLLASAEILERAGIEFFPADRGGDITYHGPGQIVGYPILQLAEIRRDVVWYVRQLEEAMIQASAAFGVTAFRVPGRTGVWVQPSAGESGLVPFEEKLGAIGVHISRWVTSHGFAYNVSSDLRYFDLIVPCGIAGRRATSLEKVLGRRVITSEVIPHLTAALGRALGLEMAPADPNELHKWLAAARPVAAEATGVTAT